MVFAAMHWIFIRVVSLGCIGVAAVNSQHLSEKRLKEWDENIALGMKDYD